MEKSYIFTQMKGSVFLRTRKQYPAGPIQICVHHGRLRKKKGHAKENGRHRVD